MSIAILLLLFFLAVHHFSLFCLSFGVTDGFHIVVVYDDDGQVILLDVV